MSSKETKPSSPLANKLSDTMMRLFRAAPDVVAADYANADIQWSKTTAADGAKARRQRQARNQIRNLNNSSYDRTRRTRYSDYREMLDEVPEMASALQVLVDFVFGGRVNQALRIEFTDESTDAQRSVIDAAWRTLGGSSFFENIFREGTYLGDSFSELIYSKAGLVAERSLTPGLVDVNVDPYGQVTGYTIGASSSNMGKEKGLIIGPFQCLHYAPDRIRGHRYGRSMWASARKLWRQSESIEDVMGLLSLLQASARKSVALPLPSNVRPDEVDQYLDQLKSGAWTQKVFDRDGKMRRRIASLLAMDDIVYPYREGSDKPTFHNEPSANLEQLISVLRYLQERYFIAAGVPAALCGYERNVNSRATLEQQGLQFVRTVHRKQLEVSALVEDAMLRAMAAAGVRPELTFEVIAPPVSSFDEKLRAEIRNINANTAKVLGQDVGLNLRFVLSNTLGLSDEEVNLILETATIARLERPQGSQAVTMAAIDETNVRHALESLVDTLHAGREGGYVGLD